MLRIPLKYNFLFFVILVLTLVCLMFGQRSYAAINDQMNFQGSLTNPDGTNVTDGSYSILFSIYTASSGGTAVWSETQSVSVNDGVFHVALGSVTSMTGAIDFNNSSLYLGIKVGADSEMTPRVRLTASPYAFNSINLNGLGSDQFAQLAQGVQTDSSSSNASISINKTGATAKILDLQRSGTTVAAINNNGSALFKNSTDSTSGFEIQDQNSATVLRADNSGKKVVVGSDTTDTAQVLLQIDSFNTFADTASCSSTTNQGGIYYNTQSNSIRGCIDGSWQDLASTAGLGLQLFGVVPESGANPGDLAAVTGVQNGPCKVSVGSNTQTVSWTSCTAYSGGRKVIITSGSSSTTNSTSNNFQHLCLTGSNNQPVLSSSGSETANLSTLSLPSVNSPILCLADIKFAAANNTISQIYDTRTYTTSTKVATTINSSIGIGSLVQNTSTQGVVATTTTYQDNDLAGVVVATTGSASTSTINGIIAINGAASVKAVTGSDTVNSYIYSSTTAGYAKTATTKPTESSTTIYNVLGNARTAWTGANSCTANSDSCQAAVLTYIDKR